MRHFIICIITIALAMASINTYAQETKGKSIRKELREQKKAEKELRRQEQKAEKEKQQKLKNKEKESKKTEQKSKREEKEVQKTEERTEQKNTKEDINAGNPSPLKRSDNPEKQERTTTKQYEKENALPPIEEPESPAAVPTYDDPHASNEKTESENGESVVWIIIAIMTFSFIRWVYSKRCGKCGKFWAMKDLGGEHFLGTVKTVREKDANGNIYYAHHNKIRHIYRCKYCGHEEYRTKIEKE